MTSDAFVLDRPSPAHGSPPPPARPGAVERSGRWLARHRWWVIVAWLAILVGATVGSSALNGSYNATLTLPGTSAQTGADLLTAHSPASTVTNPNAAAGTVVLHVGSGSLATDQAAVTSALDGIRAIPGVASVSSPKLSPDGRVGVVSVQYADTVTGLGASDVTAIDQAVSGLRGTGVLVDYGGDIGSATRASSQLSDLVGIGAALIILLIVFGSILATVLPVLTAVVGVFSGIGVLGILSAGIQFPNEAPTIAVMLGLGVGIDYALFLSTRFRQLILDGVDPVTAVGRTVASSGRAVLIAAGTVVIAIGGLYASGIFYIGQLGIAAAITVAVAALAAVTLVPATLAVAGRRIDRLRVRRSTVAETPGTDGVWYRFGMLIARRPAVWLTASLLVLLALATPTLSITLGNPGASALPTQSTERRAADAIAAGFGAGSSASITVVVTQPAGITDAQLAARSAALTAALAPVAGVAAVSDFAPTPDHALLVGTVTPTTASWDTATAGLVHRLDATAVPGALAAGESGYVTGGVASQVALQDRVTQTLPWVIGTVVLAAMLLILLTFRSPVLALKAGIVNLLSIGASYGVVVAVFQWGWGSGLFGIPQAVPIVSFVPTLMFAIVFGLSMDYEVFLLARIREARLAGHGERESVAVGLGATGRIISCAAAIMACVFFSFLLQASATIQMLALGLGASVLIDATIVRLILVPAAMNLMGRANWWTPRWLDRVLPHLEP